MTLAAVGDQLVEPVAVVGMGCRFPGGASTPAAFWQLLSEGKSAIGPIPLVRWETEKWYDADPSASGKMNSRWGAFLDGIDQFDCAFFGITPREANLMDPQQRLLLEAAWEALEDGAIAPTDLAGTSGAVFMGVGSANYSALLHGNASAVEALTNSGGSPGIVANRISYCLDLRGPSVAVDAACCSSLVAVHLACQSLWTGESSIALAGGVNVILSPTPSVSLSKSRSLSPDGSCRVFDAGANGFVRGEGAGVVVLKLLSRALADGDPIHAVIRGAAMRQGGRTNGLSAPSRWAQEAVVHDACRRAGVTPARIQYIESHSAGSLIGDATELNGLAAVLGPGRPARNKCAIGSVKPNIGHLEAASGMAGLIKVVMMLRHRQLVPTLHFQTPNPHVRFDALPLRVQRDLSEWSDAHGPRLAGIGGSGFGGTYAHVLLEEAPPAPQAPPERSSMRLVTLSGRSMAALKELAAAYRSRLTRQPEMNLDDLSLTLATGRSHFAHRLAIIADTVDEARQKLSAFIDDRPMTGVCVGVARRKLEEAPRPAARQELAEQYVAGFAIDWRSVMSHGRRVASLPTYPFQRQRHWVAPSVAPAPTTAPAPLPTSVTQNAAATTDLASKQGSELALIQIWKDILGTTVVHAEDNFFELGGGSMMAIELFSRIEHSLKVRLEPAILFDKPTVRELAEAIDATRPQAPSRKLLSLIRAGRSGPPVILLTPGHLFQFTALSRRLSAGHAIYVGAFPVHFSTPGITIDEIASGYRAEIERICPIGGFHLFGFCAGGIVAMEIAQQLKAAGRAPLSVGMVDAPCPRPGQAGKQGRAGYFASRVRAHLRTMRELPLREAFGYVVSRGKFLPMVLRIPGFRTARPEQLVTVAHREAVERYRPRAYEGPLDLYLAEEPWPSAREDSRLLWREFAPRGRTHHFAGVHDGLLKIPRVLEVADRLNEVLAASPAHDAIEAADLARQRQCRDLLTV